MTTQIKHTDIRTHGWIDNILPAPVRPYAYLMRLDRPIGTWLLLLPGWWAIMLAAGGALSLNTYDLKLLVLFGIGAVIMRGAGCVVNDLWDRDLDKSVERTAGRPLAAGTVMVPRALVFLALLLLGGLAILLQMNMTAILLGCLTIPLIVCYPLMKRITFWPQAFLGITFNAGALIGWAAVTGALALAPLLLYIAGLFWTLGYDTIYAHQDKEDDALIGIKSLALKLGARSKHWIAGFYTLSWVLMLAAFMLAGAGWLSCAALTLAALHFAWQLRRWDMDDHASSLRFFRANRDLGLLVLLAAAL